MKIEKLHASKRRDIIVGQVVNGDKAKKKKNTCNLLQSSICSNTGAR
jgi:hypothetical protein